MALAEVVVAAAAVPVVLAAEEVAVEAALVVERTTGPGATVKEPEAEVLAEVTVTGQPPAQEVKVEVVM